MDDYLAQERAVTLGALGAAPDVDRYYWVSDEHGEYCEDGSTGRWAPTTKCAAAGVDTCAIFAGQYGLGDDVRGHCECWASALDDDGFGRCALSEGRCAGCYGDSSADDEAYDFGDPTNVFVPDAGACQDQSTGICSPGGASGDCDGAACAGYACDCSRQHAARGANIVEVIYLARGATDAPRAR